jgi:hypothetical protein
VTPAKAREGGTLIEAVSADEFGSRVWPTPWASANELRTLSSGPVARQWARTSLSGVVCDIERDEGREVPPTFGCAGPLSPYWVEWLMGMPIGWTDQNLSND